MRGARWSPTCRKRIGFWGGRDVVKSQSGSRAEAWVRRHYPRALTFSFDAVVKGERGISATHPRTVTHDDPNQLRLRLPCVWLSSTLLMPPTPTQPARDAHTDRIRKHQIHHSGMRFKRPDSTDPGADHPALTSLLYPEQSEHVVLRDDHSAVGDREPVALPACGVDALNSAVHMN